MTGVCAAAIESDRGRMIELWHEAFPDDTDEDVEAFFALFFRYAFVSRVNEVVASMLFLLPATLNYNGESLSVGYIYAGATVSVHRGNGLYRGLIRFALSYARTQGMKAVFLRPADETLAASYRRMGFTVPMTCRELTAFSSKQDPSLVVCDAPTYCAKRCRRLDELSVPYIEWNVEVVKYALSWCRAVATESGVGLIADTESGTVVWEWLTESEFPPIANATFVRTTGTENIIGLLYPFSEEIFAAMSPIYMGYGLE